MKVTWLGQAGLMFETGGRTILVDPYLSDSVAATEPHNRRRVPADERFLQVVPDVVVCTHNHGDHADRETLKHYFSRTSAALCLAPASVWEWVRAFGGLNNTYVAFNAGSEWTYETVRFRAARTLRSVRDRRHPRSGRQTILCHGRHAVQRTGLFRPARRAGLCGVSAGKRQGKQYERYRRRPLCRPRRR